MLAIELLLRWTHILAAIGLAGGTMFRLFALMPATENLDADSRQRLSAGVRTRWSRVVMITSALLLLSGLGSFMLIVTRYEFGKQAFPGSAYHMLFGIKFLLALIVFTLASLLAGRTTLADRLRAKERVWTTVNLILAIILVCLGGLLKVSERNPKRGPTEPVAHVEVSDGNRSLSLEDRE